MERELLGINAALLLMRAARDRRRVTRWSRFDRLGVVAPSPGARRNADEFLEGAIERGFGFVADRGGSGGDGGASSFQELGRKLETPPRKIVHRRYTDKVGETLSENRARQADVASETLERQRL